MFGCWFGPLLVNPRDIEVTPDGKQVVVANGGFLPPLPPPNPQNLGASVTVFDRDQAGFGALVPHPNVGGACVTHWPTIECPQELQGVWGTTQLAIADDRNIYSISRDSPYRVLHHIVRDPATGNLTGDRNWCLRGPDSAAACPATTVTNALLDAFDIAIGPGSAFYASGYGGQRVGVFDRLPDNTLNPKPDTLACVSAGGPPGCRQLVNATSIEYVQPSPDGKHVYGLGLDKVFTFAVDTAPRCSGQTVDTAHNTTATIALQCTDVDGDPLVFRKVSDPARGRLLGPQGGSILYEPLLGTSGTDTFQFTAVGADIAADPATVTVNVAAPPLAIVDADGDGSPATADCNERNPRVRPGVREIPGNAVDENCDGRRGLGRLGTVGSEWDSFIDHTVATRLRMANTPAGAKGQIRCTGGDCRFRRRNVRRRGRVIDFLRALKPAERSFEPGQTIEVRVTAPNYLGKVVRYRIESRAVPEGKTLCLPPGVTRPRSRC